MVYILLGDGFEEAEALCAADLLRRGNAEVSLTGLGEGPAVTGAHGITVCSDRKAGDVTLKDGDMLVLPGGLGGVMSMEASEPAMALIRQAAESDRIWLCAICAAPTLLARAGLLRKGTQAVCYPGMEDALTQAGVLAQMDQSVVEDGSLITGRAPGSAFDFGLKLVEVLKGPEAARQVQAGLHYSRP